MSVIHDLRPQDEKISLSFFSLPTKVIRPLLLPRWIEIFKLQPNKTSFLPVVIAPVPFCFNFIPFCSSDTGHANFVLIDVQYSQNAVFNILRMLFLGSYHLVKKSHPPSQQNSDSSWGNLPSLPTPHH